MRMNLACLITALCATAACTSEHHDPLPAPSAHELQQTLDAVVANGVAPGVSLVVDDPRYARYTATAGVANRDTGAAVTPADRFRAGSMLKTAVATAILQLVEQDRLSLDATLDEMLPAATTAHVPNASRITLRMLLDHTSGLPEFSTPAQEAEILADPGRIWTVVELLDRSAALPRPFEPGAGWGYSNTDYVLLGEVLVATTGIPWRKLVTDRVFFRAGLQHSALPEPGDTACDGCARGYEAVDGALIDMTGVDPSMAGAAGGHALITTPSDLATFLRALEDGELFDHASTLTAMHAFVAAPNPNEAQTGYGLGLTQFDAGHGELVGHLGGTAGYQGFMLEDTARGIVVTGYMTTRGDLGAFLVPVLDAVARIP